MDEIRSEAAPVTQSNAPAAGGPDRPLRRPEWLRVRLPQGGQFADTSGIVASHRLHTVCRSANWLQAWKRRRAATVSRSPESPASDRGGKRVITILIVD